MINIIAFVVNKNILYRTHLIFLLASNRLSYNNIIRSFNITNIFKTRFIINIYFIGNKLTRLNKATIAKIVND